MILKELYKNTFLYIVSLSDHAVCDYSEGLAKYTISKISTIHFP